MSIFIIMFYLIEPYNAYQQPPKKKHPSEILEEERLFYQSLQEAENKKVNESLEANENPFTKDGRTFLLHKDDGNLPDSIAAHGRGPGYADYIFFNPNITLAFSSSVQSGHKPFQVTFFNQSFGDIGLIDYHWTFGDGGTSNAINPNHTYNTTGVFEVDLTGSAKSNGSIRSLLGVPNYISSSN